MWRVSNGNADLFPGCADSTRRPFIGAFRANRKSSIAVVIRRWDTSIVGAGGGFRLRPRPAIRPAFVRVIPPAVAARRARAPAEESRVGICRRIFRRRLGRLSRLDRRIF